MMDSAGELQERVRAALAQAQPLQIVGGGSKAFYGREAVGESLEVAAHRGIVHYEPTELVLTARAGTPLQEIEAVLAEKNQMLAFEPPHFGDRATLGGTVACGFSGPRRPFAGALRDSVLGCKFINGRAEILRLGGEVMKNVAGYDVSRLMAGSLGCLGVLLEVSLRVLPRPEVEATIRHSLEPDEAIRRMNQWSARPLPLSGLCYCDHQLYARLSGSPQSVHAGLCQLGGETVAEGDDFWADLREQRLPFFSPERNLWRLSLAPATPPLDLPGEVLVDWGGGLRWLSSTVAAAELFALASRWGGHATLMRPLKPGGGLFQPLPSAVMALHRALKQAFDPKGVFNPGRMYPEF